MGKCPRCSWKGSAKQFQKHYASKHFKGKLKAQKKRVFKVPGFAKKRRR